MSVNYTPDGEWLTSASSNGVLQFYGKHNCSFRPFGYGEALVGLTNVSFCSDYDDEQDAGNLYWMSSSTSDGRIRVYQVLPGTTYKSLGEATENGNETLVTAIAPDHSVVATGSADRILRIYQLTNDNGIRLTRTIEQGIDPHGGGLAAGHSSRIFSIKFVPQLPQCFLSAGWESNVLLYDIRAPLSPVRQFVGPRISGDAVDVKDNLIACASDRLTSQIQFFDLRDGAQIGNDVNVGANLFGLKLAPSLNSSKELVAWVAGSQGNCVKCVSVKTGEELYSVENVEESMFAIDVCPDRPGSVHVGGGKGALYRIQAVGSQ